MNNQYIVADIIEKHIGTNYTKQVLLAAEEIELTLEIQSLKERIALLDKVIDKVKPNNNKQQLIDWALSFGKDENWIDERFIFHKDGRIESKNEWLSLKFMGISYLPKAFSAIEGVTTLYLNGNNISKIENIPDNVTKLSLGSNNISKIENIPDNVTTLSLGSNNISKIENISDGVTNLYLGGNPIENPEDKPETVKHFFL